MILAQVQQLKHRVKESCVPSASTAWRTKPIDMSFPNLMWKHTKGIEENEWFMVLQSSKIVKVDKDQTSFTTRRRPLKRSQTALIPSLDLEPKEDTNSTRTRSQLPTPMMSGSIPKIRWKHTLHTWFESLICLLAACFAQIATLYRNFCRTTTSQQVHYARTLAVEGSFRYSAGYQSLIASF